MKSTPDQIRERFDNDVERFSNLETGQTAIPDAVILLETVTKAAAAVTPNAKRVIDVGCGAGNFTLRLLGELPNLDCTLVDLSLPMLARATQRVSEKTSGTIEIHQTDIRELDLPDNSADIVLAGASLHHLRDESQWQNVFAKIYRWLAPGGSFWISDMIEHANPAVQKLMRDKYGDYLLAQKGKDYRDKVFEYIDAEDTPRPLEWQLDLLRAVGFSQVEILYKNSFFAAFGGIK